MLGQYTIGQRRIGQNGTLMRGKNRAGYDIIGEDLEDRVEKIKMG